MGFLIESGEAIDAVERWMRAPVAAGNLAGWGEVLGPGVTALSLFPATSTTMRALEMGDVNRDTLLGVLQQRVPAVLRRFEQLFPRSRPHDLSDLLEIGLSDRAIVPSDPLIDLILPTSHPEVPPEEIGAVLGGRFVYKAGGAHELVTNEGYTVVDHRPFPLSIITLPLTRSAPPSDSLQSYGAPADWQAVRFFFRLLRRVVPGGAGEGEELFEYEIPGAGQMTIEARDGSRTLRGMVVSQREAAPYAIGSETDYRSSGERVQRGLEVNGFASRTGRFATFHRWSARDNPAGSPVTDIEGPLDPIVSQFLYTDGAVLQFSGTQMMARLPITEEAFGFVRGARALLTGMEAVWPERMMVSVRKRLPDRGIVHLRITPLHEGPAFGTTQEVAVQFDTENADRLPLHWSYRSGLAEVDAIAVNGANADEVRRYVDRQATEAERLNRTARGLGVH